MKRWSSLVNPSVFAVSFVTAFAGLTELAQTAARIGTGDSRGITSRPNGAALAHAVQPPDFPAAFGFDVSSRKTERAGDADAAATEARPVDAEADAPMHDFQTVIEAQETLQRRGFDVGTIDGILGPRTESALRDFQAQHGLGRSGQLDRETLAALEKDADGPTGLAANAAH